MQNIITPFKVGFVIIVGLIMTIAMIVKFSSDWGRSRGTYELYAYFDDVTGLLPRSQVRVAGIQIGEVRSISLDGNVARVVFAISENVVLHEGEEQNGFFKNGATIAKKMSGILGDYHLDLTPGVQGRQLVAGDRIYNVLQTMGFEALLNDAGRIMANVSQVTETMSSVFGGNEGEQRFMDIIEDLHETMRAVREIATTNTDKINAIVMNVEAVTRDAAKLAHMGSSEMPVLTRELRAAVADMRSMIRSTQSGVDGTFSIAHDSIAKLADSIDKLDRSLTNIERITQRMDEGEGSVGRLLVDNTIADEAESLLKETRALIRSGTETVDGANALLSPISNMNVDISLRSDYLINANAFRVDFGVKLQSSPDKFYLLNLIMDPNGKSTTKHVLTDSSASGPVYETVTTTDSSFLFSAQFAKRWRWFVGRFGIIENTGGIGGDLMLFNDDLRFAVDLYDFNGDKYPRMRATALAYLSLAFPWNWTKAFYLSAGIDNPFNHNTFDYYFGLGFRFSDNDVKSLMGILPRP